MSGHTVPVDARGVPTATPLRPGWFVPRSLPPPAPRYLGTRPLQNGGIRLEKEKWREGKEKSPAPVSRGSFCSLKWLPGGSQGCGHGGAGGGEQHQGRMPWRCQRGARLARDGWRGTRQLGRETKWLIQHRR